MLEYYCYFAVVAETTSIILVTRLDILGDP